MSIPMERNREINLFINPPFLHNKLVPHQPSPLPLPEGEGGIFKKNIPPENILSRVFRAFSTALDFAIKELRS